MKILIKFRFNGRNYCGYQFQKNSPTVQQQLNKAAKKLFGFDCDITGCSRTDRGVHAEMFCATIVKSGENNFKSNVPIENIPFALNSFLPSDIAVFDASFVDDSFHARHDVVKKEYLYKIWASPIRNPLYEGLCFNYPKNIGEEEFEQMKIAAEQFVGVHEFNAFMARGSKITDTKREIFYTSLTRNDSMIEFRICGDGFLYNMVRIIIGTLLAVSEDKIQSTSISAIIEQKGREFAGMTAPPQGLYLSRVDYN